MNSAEFSGEELDKFINELELKKAPGYDNIILKYGILRIFYKGSGKGPKAIKSYRPLTLLLVLDKVRASPGFRRGKSTELPILDMVTKVRSIANTHHGIPLDIAGAFDNPWWPEVLWKLKR
ncbi:hypothetical protein PR048_028979 [Dryococelus australis]|uniref:Reverse transcriptase domain-containing protein n=1 Tax=Dryococelus australis TaxID=614101 RepID=A0ABQ9GEU9_9NEOP|nr:hypothetical protein PR048_028979 [Dryococelus australis]